MRAQKFMGAQKLLGGHDASASLRHPQMAPVLPAARWTSIPPSLPASLCLCVPAYPSVCFHQSFVRSSTGLCSVDRISIVSRQLAVEGMHEPSNLLFV